APGLRELEFIDRTVGRKLARRRQRGCVPPAETGPRERRRHDNRAERRPAEDRHRNLPPRRPIAAQHRRAVRLLQPCTAGTRLAVACMTAPDRRRQRTRLEAQQEDFMAGTVEKKLAELGIALPTPASPVANYIPFVRVGALLFVSGQICLDASGKLVAKGKLGNGVSLEDGQK